MGPQKWKRENVAGFLLFCSEGLILHFIQSKLKTGKEEQIKQAGSILVDMVVISHKFDNTIEPDKGIGKVFDIISAYQKHMGIHYYGNPRKSFGFRGWRTYRSFEKSRL